MIEWFYGFIGLVSLLYLSLTWNHNYWKKRDVPCPKALPGVGNMFETFMFKKSSNFVFLDLYRKFPKEPICGFIDMCTPALLVRKPELIQTILTKDFSNFHDNDVTFVKDVDPYMYRNPFSSKGADWKANRAALSPAFTVGKMKTAFPQMKDVCKRLEDYLNSHIKEDIEVRELSLLFSTEIISNCAFGIQGNSFTDPDHVLKKMSKKMEENFHSAFMMFSFFSIPALSKILRLRFVPESVYKFLKDALMQVDEYREKNNIVRNDFVDFILAPLKKNKDNGDDPDVTMLGHAVTFFMEGIQTSSIITSFLLYELARNPLVQEKLKDEILTNFPTTENLDFDTLHKLPYLHKVVSETLRMYPAGVALKKICTKSTVLDVEGKILKVEKGTPIAISIYGIHNDPEYFPNPEKFDPERFSEENTSTRHQYCYLPFGEGPRMCVGLRFALTQMKLFVAAIMIKYSIQSCEKTVKQITLDQRDMFPTSVEDMWVKFVEN